jgi:fused signal recognition particle receptor
VPIIRHEEGADPAAVIFDAIQSARSRGTDILLCDTAGRLHNKKNLMNELEKMNRVIDREFPEAHKEVLLVLDATTGQNAVSQASLFREVVGINGIALTKLDGTAKGGVIIAVKSLLDIPVYYVGVGEQTEDLQPFVPEDFTDALFES